jgi:hypothetical protein
MQTVKFIYWQEDDAWLDYLQDYPDYWTQGETLNDLKDHLQSPPAGFVPRSGEGSVASYPQDGRVDRGMKRSDLIKTIEGFGCVFVEALLLCFQRQEKQSL